MSTFRMARSTVKTESPQSSQIPSLKKSTSGSQPEQNQKSILGFFHRKATPASQDAIRSASKVNGSSSSTQVPGQKTLVQKIPKRPNQTLTPAPSSDAMDDIDEEDFSILGKMESVIEPPSPITPTTNAAIGTSIVSSDLQTFNSPSRKVNIIPRRSFIQLLLLIYSRQRRL